MPPNFAVTPLTAAASTILDGSRPGSDAADCAARRAAAMKSDVREGVAEADVSIPSSTASDCATRRAALCKRMRGAPEPGSSGMSAFGSEATSAGASGRIVAAARGSALMAGVRVGA